MLTSSLGSLQELILDLSVPALVADRSAASVENNGITSTIADDRAVASVQNEPFPFVLGDKLLDRFAHI
jgi:hypothetical protein